MKIKIPGLDKYFYPDVFITKEVNTGMNRYAKTNPNI